MPGEREESDEQNGGRGVEDKAFSYGMSKSQGLNEQRRLIQSMVK